MLDNLINSEKRNYYFEFDIQRTSIKRFKRKKKKNNQSMGFLSLSYCNVLIRLHNFAEKHENTLKYALRLEFIHKNFAMLKQAFQELGW